MSLKPASKIQIPIGLGSSRRVVANAPGRRRERPGHSGIVGVVEVGFEKDPGLVEIHSQEKVRVDQREGRKDPSEQLSRDHRHVASRFVRQSAQERGWYLEADVKHCVQCA